MDPLRPQSPPATELAELVRGLDSVTLQPPGSRATVTGVTLDSRAVHPGDLYAALPGANVHGGDFAAAAVRAGAVAILTDDHGESLLRQAGVGVPVLRSDDPRARLGELSARVYRTDPLGIALIGITGTNGKTTTAYLVHSALSALGRTAGLIGTVELRIGEERVKSARTTPEAPALHGLMARMRESGADTCVMEVSSHALALHRVDGLVFDVAGFMNLSQDHLDFHPDMDDYFAAKASLFTPHRARRAVVCIDDPWGRRLAGQAPIEVRTLGRAEDAHYRVLARPGDPAAFTLATAHGPLELRSALPGDFNQINTAMAAALLLELGIEPAAVARAVLTDPHVPGRMEVVPGGEADPLCVVDYAHTPHAVSAALAALRSRATDGLIVVLGAGGDRDRGKRVAMGAAAAAGADLFIVTDDNPRSEDPGAIRAALAAGAAEAGGAAVIQVADRRGAIAEAVAEARRRGPGAVVAVLGKGHESGQEIAGTIHPFDDRAEVAAALAGSGARR